MTAVYPVDADGLPAVSFVLGELKMSLTPNGMWNIHSDALHQFAKREDVAALQSEMQQITRKQQALNEEMDDLEDEREDIMAKNTVLIDMVAEKEAENQRLKEALDGERLKVEALKWKLAAPTK